MRLTSERQGRNTDKENIKAMMQLKKLDIKKLEQAANA
jgi:hypothetical protein